MRLLPLCLVVSTIALPLAHADDSKVTLSAVITWGLEHHASGCFCALKLALAAE